MIYIFSEPLSEDFLEDWEVVVNDFSIIKGYSVWGHIFLLNSTTNEIAILSPLENDLIPMGYTDWSKFDSEILRNPEFQIEVLKKHDFLSLVNKLGELKNLEIYIPAPYPFLGGSGELDTYSKGDISVFLSLVFQSWNN